MNLILLFLLLLLGMVSSRPARQRIVINNHEWEVPNEPGWEEVVKEAEAVQKRHFRLCSTLEECSRIREVMNTVFYSYPVSKKYLEEQKGNVDDILPSIFKWG